jgi:DNA invertase Pin-like site-specific DNA recombinase
MRDLKALRCEKLYYEQVSSVGLRPQLVAALEFVRSGDTLIVTKLDRLARSMVHLGTIIADLEAKGVTLRIVNLSLDTSTPSGRLILNVLGGVAQFERAMALERQREGIAKAKAEGANKGRKPSVWARAEEVQALAAQGLSMNAIVVELGVSKGSVHRILTAPSRSLSRPQSPPSRSETCSFSVSLIWRASGQTCVRHTTPT